MLLAKDYMNALLLVMDRTDRTTDIDALKKAIKGLKPYISKFPVTKKDIDYMLSQVKTKLAYRKDYRASVTKYGPNHGWADTIPFAHQIWLENHMLDCRMNVFEHASKMFHYYIHVSTPVA